MMQSVGNMNRKGEVGGEEPREWDKGAWGKIHNVCNYEEIFWT